MLCDVTVCHSKFWFDIFGRQVEETHIFFQNQQSITQDALAVRGSSKNAKGTTGPMMHTVSAPPTLPNDIIGVACTQ